MTARRGGLLLDGFAASADALSGPGGSGWQVVEVEGQQQTSPRVSEARMAGLRKRVWRAVSVRNSSRNPCRYRGDTGLGEG